MYNKSSVGAALMALWRTLLQAGMRVESNPLAQFLV